MAPGRIAALKATEAELKKTGQTVPMWITNDLRAARQQLQAARDAKKALSPAK